MIPYAIAALKAGLPHDLGPALPSRALPHALDRGG